MDAKSKWFWTIFLVTRSHPHSNITTLFEEIFPREKKFLEETISWCLKKSSPLPFFSFKIIYSSPFSSTESLLQALEAWWKWNCALFEE